MIYVSTNFIFQAGPFVHQAAPGTVKFLQIPDNAFRRQAVVSPAGPDRIHNNPQVKIVRFWTIQKALSYLRSINRIQYPHTVSGFETFWNQIFMIMPCSFYSNNNFTGPQPGFNRIDFAFQSSKTTIGISKIEWLH